MSARTFLSTFAVGATLTLVGCASQGPRAPLPYQSSALNAPYSAPYQRPGATATPQPVSTTGGSSPRVAVADAPPTRQRRASSRPSGRPAGTEQPRTETVRAPIDPNAPKPTPGGGYSPQDAVAYIVATYAMNGVNFDHADQLKIIDLYRAVQREGSIYHTTQPVVGDLVFFHNTYDANRDGRNNDWYTHVGLVEQVSSDGSIVVLSYRRGAVVRDMMNLKHPHAVEENGRMVNASLREKRRDDAEYTQYLAGELFAGFGSLLGDVSDVAVLDSWSPSRR